MKIIRAIAAIALAACGQTAEALTQTAPKAIATADQARAKVAPASNTITSASLVGRWGDNGDCMKDIVFAADGTFRSFTGGSGTWRLDGDILTMSGPGGSLAARIEMLSDSQLIIYNPDGSVGTSQRC